MGLLALLFAALLVAAIIYPCILRLDSGPGYQRAWSQNVLQAVAAAIDKFRLLQGYTPRTFDEVSSVLNRPPKDAWGTAIVYRMSESGSPIYYSAGPNRQDDGGKGDDMLPTD